MLSSRPFVSCSSLSRRSCKAPVLRPSAIRSSQTQSCMLDRRAALMLMPLSLILGGEAAAPGAADANALSDVLKGALLKAQRADGGAKLIAPFFVALQRLDEAKKALQDQPGGGALAAVTAIKSVRSSSLNCYVFEALPDDDNETRASLITQQMQLADPCTFRLIVKNVSSFSTPEIKAQGQELVQTTILAYSQLDNALVDSMQEGSSVKDVERALEQLDVTSKSITAMKEFVERTLQVVAV